MLKAQFDTSICGLCQQKIAKGIEIKNHKNKWCHKSCVDAIDTPQEKPKTETSQASKNAKEEFKEKTNFDTIIKNRVEAANKVSLEIFKTTLIEAEKYFPKIIKKFEGVQIDKNEKNRFILAEVFYKGIVDLIE